MSDIVSSFKLGSGFSTFRCFGGYFDAFFKDDGFFGLGGSSSRAKADSLAQPDNKIDSSWGNIEGRLCALRNGSSGVT
jgi:hypothetical protein